MINRLVFFAILMTSAEAFGLKPKFKTECSTAILNAAALRASEITEEHSYRIHSENPKVPAPQSASIRVIHDLAGWKIRVIPHGENAGKYIVEFRVPIGIGSELYQGAIPQEGFISVRSYFGEGIHRETRVSSQNRSLSFEFLVRMISPTEVDSITYKFADKNGVVEENTWHVGPKETLN